MDHMEYLQNFAKKDRIDVNLRNLLRKMTKLSGIRTSETWIDDRLENLPASLAAPAPEVAEPCITVQRDAVLRLADASFRRAPKHAMYMKAIRKKPEYQTWLSNLKKALWQDDAYRAKTIAGIRKSWVGNDERRAAHSARSIEIWQDEGRKANISAVRVEMWKNLEYRDKVAKAKANTGTFRRDDSNFHWKKLWDNAVQVASDWAAGLKSEELEFWFFKAFTILHLEPSHYGVLFPTSFVYSNDSRGVAADFFERAAAGGPWYSPDDIGSLMEEHKWTQSSAQGRIKIERGLWLRSAAILRLKGISVDYASIPHLAWVV